MPPKSSKDLSPHELLERKMEIVFEGVSLLPDKCAEVFILSKREGLTNIEIADYLNISLKTVDCLPRLSHAKY